MIAKLIVHGADRSPLSPVGPSSARRAHHRRASVHGTVPSLVDRPAPSGGRSGHHSIPGRTRDPEHRPIGSIRLVSLRWHGWWPRRIVPPTDPWTALASFRTTPHRARRNIGLAARTAPSSRSSWAIDARIVGAQSPWVAIRVGRRRRRRTRCRWSSMSSWVGLRSTSTEARTGTASSPAVSGGQPTPGPATPSTARWSPRSPERSPRSRRCR